MIRILFVCLGNICRSPVAEEVFRKLIEEKGLQKLVECDSAGTSNFHIGELPDERAIKNAKTHGLELKHKARQLTEKDLEEFDYVLAMDKSNLRNILLMQMQSKDRRYAEILLMREFDPKNEQSFEVPDPYYGTQDDFENVYQIIKRSSEGFIEFLEKHSFKKS